MKYAVIYEVTDKKSMKYNKSKNRQSSDDSWCLEKGEYLDEYTRIFFSAE